MVTKVIAHLAKLQKIKLLQISNFCFFPTFAVFLGLQWTILQRSQGRKAANRRKFRDFVAKFSPIGRREKIEPDFYIALN